MKGVVGSGVLTLLVALGCGTDSSRGQVGAADAGDDASSGGKSGENRGDSAVGDAAGDSAAGGGGGAPDGSIDGGTSSGGGGAGSGGTSAGGGTGAGGQSGNSKQPSTDPASPVDLEGGDVVGGNLSAGDHFWRIPVHDPARYGLILRSSSAVTIGVSDDPNGGLVQPGANGCSTGSKGECGLRINASFLTAGQPVTLFVFGPTGATYDLEIVPLDTYQGMPPSSGFSHTLVYGTRFEGTMPTAEGPLTKGAPTTEAEIWSRYDAGNVEWLRLGGFTCAARPFTTTQMYRSDVTNLTFGQSSYAGSNGAVTFTSGQGPAFTTGQSLTASVTAGGVTTSTTLKAPTFSGDATASLAGGALDLEWAQFSADVATLTALVDTAAGDVQLTCRLDAGASREATGMSQDIKKQILARGWALYYLQLAACTTTRLSPQMIAALFTVQAQDVLLCHMLRVSPQALATKF